MSESSQSQTTGQQRLILFICGLKGELKREYNLKCNFKSTLPTTVSGPSVAPVLWVRMLALVKAMLHAPLPQAMSWAFIPLGCVCAAQRHKTLSHNGIGTSHLFPARSMTREAVCSFPFFPRWWRSCSKAMKCTQGRGLK